MLKRDNVAPNEHTRERVSVVVASALVTTAGGVLEAQVYLAHGHVFASARQATSCSCSKALTGSQEEWAHTLVLTTLCVAFGVGALVGSWLTPRMGKLTLLSVAALVAATIAAAPRRLDAIPDWKDLQ